MSWADGKCRAGFGVQHLLEAKIAKEKELGKELKPDETIQLFEDELKKLRDGKHNPQRIIRE
jgi:hypothetical protein